MSRFIGTSIALQVASFGVAMGGIIGMAKSQHTHIDPRVSADQLAAREAFPRWRGPLPTNSSVLGGYGIVASVGVGAGPAAGLIGYLVA